MIYNILISFTILLLVLLSSFAMYLPFRALIKDKAISLRYAIPFSLSVEILFGYIYYCTSTMSYFPICYLVFALFLNILAYVKLKPIILTKISVNIGILLVLIISVLALLYTRYFDSFSFVGPGGNDTYAHLVFVKDLINPGFLRNGFYAPGFHIILMPIAKLIPFSDLYRFTGPAIGIVTLISFVLLFRDYLKNKILLLFLLALLALPVYNQFTLQTIGFFPSSLTFMYFVSFIFLLSDKDNEKRRANLFIFSIFTFALALTVPYLFVTILPAFLIIFFIVLIFRNKFNKKYPFYLFLINLILILGIFVSFGHVFLQSSILKRFSGINLPTIEVTITEDVKITDKLANKEYSPKVIANNSLLNSIVGTGYDILRVKNIRPVNSILGIGAYLWMGFSFFLIVYGLRKKNSILLIVAVLGVFFGLCTQTGMFEMNNYLGRSGWYLLMLSIFGSVLFFDQIYSKKMTNWLLAVCLILLITSFFFPPQYYRPYYDEEFKTISQIAKQHPNDSITLITNNKQLAIVAENITAQHFLPDFLRNDNPVLIIENKFLRPDPVLSQRVTSTDKEFIEFNKAFEIEKENLKYNIERIKSNKDFKSYRKYFENDDFAVYENIGNNY